MMIMIMMLTTTMLISDDKKLRIMKMKQMIKLIIGAMNIHRIWEISSREKKEMR